MQTNCVRHQCVENTFYVASPAWGFICPNLQYWALPSLWGEKLCGTHIKSCHNCTELSNKICSQISFLTVVICHGRRYICQRMNRGEYCFSTVAGTAEVSVDPEFIIKFKNLSCVSHVPIINLFCVFSTSQLLTYFVFCMS